MEQIIIICPTVNRAMYEIRRFSQILSGVTESVNMANLCITLLTGYKLYFKCETEGQKVLRGFHHKLYIDEFLTIVYNDKESDNTNV